MTNTPRLNLPFLYSGQAQKELTHNEALHLLDVLVQPVVQSIEQDEALPAAKPGELYIVGPNPKNEFIGHNNKIAQKQEAGWRFIGPLKWLQVTLETDGSQHRFDGNSWQAATASTPATTVDSALPLSSNSEYLIKDESGEYLKIVHLQEELPLKGAYNDTKIQIPHHSIVLAVHARVMRTIYGVNSFSIGTDDDPSRYGSSLGSARGTTNTGLTSHPLSYWHDKAIRITADRGSFTRGVVKVTVQLLKPHGPWHWD